MQLTMFQVDAFAERVFEGNPAAVCPLEQWLPDGLLQAIAAENNLSETAFFVPEGEGYHLRWFTPTAEERLCGHATLASAAVLFDRLGFRGAEIRFRTLSGELRVSRCGSAAGDDGQQQILRSAQDDGAEGMGSGRQPTAHLVQGDTVLNPLRPAHDHIFTMSFPALELERCETPEALSAGLGRVPLETWAAMDYVAVFQGEDEIRSLLVDEAALARLDRRGVVATAPGRDYDFVSRFFAPGCGIPEDPVTGSAHCELAPWWGRRLGKTRLRARQLSARGGDVLCTVEGRRVLLTGSAAHYMTATITVPDVREAPVSPYQSKAAGQHPAGSVDQVQGAHR